MWERKQLAWSSGLFASSFAVSIYASFCKIQLPSCWNTYLFIWLTDSCHRQRGSCFKSCSQMHCRVQAGTQIFAWALKNAVNSWKRRKQAYSRSCTLEEEVALGVNINLNYGKIRQGRVRENVFPPPLPLLPPPPPPPQALSQPLVLLLRLNCKSRAEISVLGYLSQQKLLHVILSMPHPPFTRYSSSSLVSSQQAYLPIMMNHTWRHQLHNIVYQASLPLISIWDPILKIQPLTTHHLGNLVITIGRCFLMALGMSTEHLIIMLGRHLLAAMVYHHLSTIHLPIRKSISYSIFYWCFIALKDNWLIIYDYAYLFSKS